MCKYKDIIVQFSNYKKTAPAMACVLLMNSYVFTFLCSCEHRVGSYPVSKGGETTVKRTAIPCC